MGGGNSSGRETGVGIGWYCEHKKRCELGLNEGQYTIGHGKICESDWQEMKLFSYGGGNWKSGTGLDIRIRTKNFVRLVLARNGTKATRSAICYYTTNTDSATK